MPYESQLGLPLRQQNLSVFSALKLTGQPIDLETCVQFLYEITDIYPRSYSYRCALEELTYLCTDLTTRVNSSLGKTIGSHVGDLGSVLAAGTFLCVHGSFGI